MIPGETVDVHEGPKVGAGLTDSGGSSGDVKISKDNAELFFDNEDSIKSKILVGADGVWSLTAKKTGLRNNSIDYGICIVEEFSVEEEILDESTVGTSGLSPTQ